MEQIIYDMEKRERQIRKLTERDWVDKIVDKRKGRKKKYKKPLKTKHDLFIDNIRQKISSIPNGYIGGEMG